MPGKPDTSEDSPARLEARGAQAPSENRGEPANSNGARSRAVTTLTVAGTAIAIVANTVFLLGRLGIGGVEISGPTITIPQLSLEIGPIPAGHTSFAGVFYVTAALLWLVNLNTTSLFQRALLAWVPAFMFGAWILAFAPGGEAGTREFGMAVCIAWAMYWHFFKPAERSSHNLGCGIVIFLVPVLALFLVATGMEEGPNAWWSALGITFFGGGAGAAMAIKLSETGSPKEE